MRYNYDLKFLERKDFKAYKIDAPYLKIKNQVKEIAVYKGGGGLGDLVVSVPFFSHLKRAFPQAKISYMGIIYPKYEKIFKSIPAIDGYIHYERPNRARGLKRYWEFRRNFKGKIDLLIDTQRRWETSFWLKNLKPRYMLSAAFALSDWPIVKLDYKRMHILEQLLVLLARLGVQDFKNLSGGITIPAAYRERAVKFLKIENKEKFVAIIPGCGMNFKNWPAEYFAQLSDMFCDAGFKPIILGSPEQMPLIKDIARRMRNRPILPSVEDADFCADIMNTAALLERCVIAVGNDSGGMHLASFLGAQSATIFGPTTPRKFAPIGNKNLIFYKALPCSPCRFQCKRKIFKECLFSIKPEDVFNSCTNFLEKIDIGQER